MSFRSVCCGSVVMNPTSIHDMGSIPGLAHQIKGSGIAVSCGVGCRCDLNPALLWLWCGPVAGAPIHSLVWELLYATGVALKRQKNKKLSFRIFLITRFFKLFSCQSFNKTHTEKHTYYCLIQTDLQDTLFKKEKQNLIFVALNEH